MRIEYKESIFGGHIHSGFLDLTAPPYSISDWYIATGIVFFVPKTTGIHKFFGCGDDKVEIYLSTDQSPGKKEKIVDNSCT